MLNKQFKIYSVDERSFYNADEEKINQQILDKRIEMKNIENFILYNQNVKTQVNYNDFIDNKKNSPYVKRLRKENSKYIKSKEFKGLCLKNNTYLHYKQEVKFQPTLYPDWKSYNKEDKAIIRKKNVDLTTKLNYLLEENKDSKDIRELNSEKISKYNLVSIFDSILCRVLKMEQDKITEDIIIVRIYSYSILWSLLNNGFNYNNEHYIFYTAGAGQIRKKKVIFIRESVLNIEVDGAKIIDTLTCGLSVEDINNSEEKGCNINKFLTYLALNNSATNLWKDFDINKSIVIPDFETILKNKKVDYISKLKKSKKIKDKDGNCKSIDYWEIQEPEKREMDIPIVHSDGCGWILPDESDKAFQFRMPWFKGLLVPTDFIKWCSKYNNSKYTIKDIWGDTWNLKKDNIKYIFSCSQFKMHKYYNSWKEYQEKFIKYHCQAGKCNIEENKFKKVNYNYQMWQTLVTSKDDIKLFTNPINEFITNSYTDLNYMLKILGATKENEHKNHKQQALEIYPELLKDKYFKDQLSSAISSMKNNARSGKFKVNGYNTFLIPDVIAWMQFIFLNAENPNGILKNNEVSCKLFNKNIDILVDRSPHLYKEHAARKNILNEDTKKWFISNGIYTSCHDLISKILQFDNDGDHATVIADSKIIDLAKNSMKDIK